MTTMAFNTRSGLEGPSPFGVCQEGELHPLTVQVALASDRVSVTGKSEGTMASRGVIVAQDAAR